MAKDLWTHKGSKFVIGTLHGDKIEITAQYNPKELARQSSAAWSVHPNTAARHSKTSENHLWMEFGNTEPRTLTFELTFDGYEEGQSIARHVENLERLTVPVDMNSRKASERRPQLCVAVWGTQTMRCVVTSVATKLSVFDSDGEPLRATSTVALKEVDVVAMMISDRDSTNVDGFQSGYAADSRTSRQMPYPPEDSKPTRVPPPNRSQSTPPTSASANAKPAAKPAPAPTPASAASPAPAPAPASIPVAASPGASAVDETPDEVAADEKREGEKSDADSARYQHGTSSQPVAPADYADSAPQATRTDRDETPEEVAADEQREGQRNDADSARYQHGTASQPVDRSDYSDSAPPQPAPDAVTSADSGTVDPKYKAAAEDME